MTAMIKPQHGKRLRQMRRLKRILPCETWMDLISSSVLRSVVRAVRILVSECYGKQKADESTQERSGRNE